MLMQNLSNYSNNPPQQRLNPQLASIEHLQKYITELTLYINENNHKYNKNMQTLKEFYDEQIDVLQGDRDIRDEEIVGLRNQVATLKDLMANRSRRLEEREIELSSVKEENEETRERLQVERRKIDELYEEMKQVRDTCQAELDRATLKTQSLEERLSQLTIENKEKEASINTLTEKVYQLEDQVAERYSLPEKIRDAEKDYEKARGAAAATKEKCRELEERLDFANAELEKYRKENQTLRILKGKFSAEKSLDVQKAVKIQRDNAGGRIKKLQTENQSLIYQINESQSRLKSMKNDLTSYETALQKEKQRSGDLQKEILASSQQKDAYISEFGELKREYEGVIQRLEDSLIDYQKKNWNMEQENKDLSDQLEAMQELLLEVKAINNMQPARKEFRRMAELQILAKRTEYKPEPIPPIKMESPVSDLGSEWEKLLGEIDRIKT